MDEFSAKLPLISHSETSVSLIQRVAAEGNNVDWHTLESIYRPLVHHQIRAFPSLAAFADDITQDVWLAVHKSLPVFVRERTGSFRTWLRRITVNRIQESLRRDKRFPITAQDESDIIARIEQLEQPNSEAASQWDGEERSRLLRFAMDRAKTEFSQNHWLAFYRSKIESESADSVCDSLQLSRANLNQINKRIMDRLRVIVADCELNFD